MNTDSGKSSWLGVLLVIVLLIGVIGFLSQRGSHQNELPSRSVDENDEVREESQEPVGIQGDTHQIALQSQSDQDESMESTSSASVEDQVDHDFEVLYERDGRGCTTAFVIEMGAGCFIYHDNGANTDKPVTVWYYRPVLFNSTSDILFAMHGSGRDGRAQRDRWQALNTGALIIAPEFSKQYYPKERNYGRGNVRDDNGAIRPESDWVYSSIEEIFSGLHTAMGFSQNLYVMAGHSAGAQFVHRMVMIKTQNRIKHAIAANAGWYLLPDQEERYPRGIQNVSVSSFDLQKSFTTKLTVLLGTEDTDPNAPDLNHDAWAEAQGAHRFARGKYFMNYVRQVADSLNAPFAWEALEVPGMGHSSADMIPVMAKVLSQ